MPSAIQGDQISLREDGYCVFDLFLVLLQDARNGRNFSKHKFGSVRTSLFNNPPTCSGSISIYTQGWFDGPIILYWVFRTQRMGIFAT